MDPVLFSGGTGGALWLLLAGYVLAMSLVAFCAMGADKRRAKKEMWRISEKTLFLLALLGGSIGSILGMKVFRHKTQHWYFKIGMPVILILQIALVIWLAVT